ncbi:hypothetical protein HMPREF9374_2526 [Desmospora sp. 8437]|nr:hypothetical protein HMPREF9374_2526 [Desmospora sp. 8437]
MVLFNIFQIRVQRTFENQLFSEEIDKGKTLSWRGLTGPEAVWYDCTNQNADFDNKGD